MSVDNPHQIMDGLPEIKRRDFLILALLGLASRSFSLEPARSPIIVALGEVHLDYDDALLHQMRSSGLSGCIITLGNPALHGPDAFDDVLGEISKYEAHIAKKSDLLMKATRTVDLVAAQTDHKLALMYGFQNMTPIGDQLARLDFFAGLGVRVIQLTYNTRNLIGDGCLERTNAGLSNFGIEVIRRMNDLRMLVDVSHCGPATTTDAITHSTKPVAVTHSGCRAVFEHPRNKSDEILRALAQRGGVIGIYQINPYLGPKERNSLDDYLAHIDHAVKVAGIDHVAIGSDREHRVIPDTDEERRKLELELAQLRPDRKPAPVQWPFFLTELNHPKRMETIAEALKNRGYKPSEIEKILGANLLRLIQDTIG